MLNMI